MGIQRLTAIIDASWNVKEYHYGVCTHPLPLDGKYLMFCSRKSKSKQSRVCKIGTHYDLHKFPLLPLTVNRNHCDPWVFQPMVGRCKIATENYDLFKEGRALSPFLLPIGSQKSKITVQHFLWIVLLDE